MELHGAVEGSAHAVIEVCAGMIPGVVLTLRSHGSPSLSSRETSVAGIGCQYNLHSRG